MTSFRALRRATSGFIRVFFRPEVKLRGLSENGHAVVHDWTHSPHEALISRARAEAQSTPNHARVGLLCTSGPHIGECFLLSQSLETIGNSVGSTMVLTPAEGITPTNYRLFLNGTVSLVGDGNDFFKLNGVEEQKAKIYDFDELELLGNQFLVLDLSPNLYSGANNE